VSAKFTNFTSQAIFLADVTEIEFPSTNIEYRVIPTQCTIEQKIPSRVTYGDLILRSTVIRNNVFAQQMQRAVDLLNGEAGATYDAVSNDFIIALYGNNGVTDILPIRSFFVKNAQPKAYTPARADANGGMNMPLEELVFTIDSIREI
jgi:hypothetical protein